jgi:hypothetical protein
MPEGEVVFSTSTDVTQGFGGIPYIRNGDLVLWDGEEATLLFSELIGFGTPYNNIDAFSILPNGNWLLSTDLNATLGGLSFQNGDIVEYDPEADVATLYMGLDEATIFTGTPNSNPDIDALHATADGKVAFSIRSDGIGRVGNGPSYGFADAPRTDLFEIDPVTLDASLFLDGDGIFDGMTRNLDAAALPLLAAVNIGMVADNSTHSVTIFNPTMDTVLGSVSIGPGSAIGDCSITADGTLGFATDFFDRVWVIDMTTITLAPPPNPIPISNNGEDTSITPDERFLVVCDGAVVQPVSVIDIATQTEISTFSLGSDCNSVEVCSDGSVLVTSFYQSRVRRLTIDGTGTLTDTGESMGVGGPNNVICAPNATSGVAISFFGRIHSFTIPGLVPVDTRNLSGAGGGLSGLVRDTGDLVYIRASHSFIDVFDYDSATGALGITPVFSIPIEGASGFYGMDQMALTGDKLYVPQPNALDVYDADTGAFLTAITDARISQPTGVCFPSSR